MNKSLKNKDMNINPSSIGSSESMKAISLWSADFVEFSEIQKIRALDQVMKNL